MELSELRMTFGHFYPGHGWGWGTPPKGTEQKSCKYKRPPFAREPVLRLLPFTGKTALIGGCKYLCPTFFWNISNLFGPLWWGTTPGLLVLNAIRKQARQARRGEPLYWDQACARCTTMQAKYSHT